jgi:cytidylate kinase
MYRAVALDALEQGILDDPDQIAQRCRLLALRFDFTRSPAPMLLNGRDVSELVRQPAVTQITYCAADNPWVREELVRQQREIGKAQGSLVTEGRDQGTIVFPHADFKFYLNAHPEERARRRIAQLEAKGISVELNEVLDQIVQRDMRDQARAVGPLARPTDAIDIDTTDLSLEETVEAMIARIQSKAPATPAR